MPFSSEMQEQINETLRSGQKLLDMCQKLEITTEEHAINALYRRVVDIGYPKEFNRDGQAADGPVDEGLVETRMFCTCLLNLLDGTHEPYLSCEDIMDAYVGMQSNNLAMSLTRYLFKSGVRA